MIDTKNCAAERCAYLDGAWEVSAGFTPGPWSRRDTETHAEIDAPGNACLAMVARADDANLIAAAPDMLEALEEARLIVANLPHGESLFLAKIDAAIAKARGRTTHKPHPNKGED